MSTNALSTEQLPLIYIEVDETKIGRVSLAYSSNAAKLRNLLSERYDISSSMHFLDKKGYPVCTKDEQSVIINDLLDDETKVVRLKMAENISVPEKKSNVPRERAELNFTSSNIQAITAPLQGPTIPGSMPSHSSQPIILANELDFNTQKKMFDNCSLLCGIRMDGKEPVRAMQPVLKFKESNCKPSITVYDDSRIRTYMRSKRMESCFVSNDYFDGGINLSCPYIGIGINRTYTKTTSNTNEERTVYSTCVFNHPRAIVELNLSYLEPTQEFIDAIDNVLQHTPTKGELEKVLLTYGHVYSQRVILGGHLFYTEEHHVQGNVAEDKVRKDVETRFKTAYFKQVEFYADIGSANRTRQEWSQQESSITFQAVGGNTLLCRNPTAWAETVANPMLWRIIEQSNYEPVITLLNKKQQLAISGESLLVQRTISTVFYAEII